MKLAENLKLIRKQEGLAQEEMAEKLGYSNNGYAKVERGESIPRKKQLKKIAEILKIDLENLLDSNNGSNVVNINSNCPNSYQSQSVILLTESQCANELEKARLLLQERDKEVENLKVQNSLLKEMLALLKTAENLQSQ
jgi:transcriptional regulator with XRE-family HTH domain